MADALKGTIDRGFIESPAEGAEAYVAQRLAEALGAHLDFESDVDGTIFWLDLPPADITGREA